MSECQYLGPEQTTWPYIACGCPTLKGKLYCGDHYWTVYQKGSAIAGRRAEKDVDKEIAELAKQQIEEETEYE